jgi:hypothetical protein
MRTGALVRASVADVQKEVLGAEPRAEHADHKGVQLDERIDGKGQARRGGAAIQVGREQEQPSVLSLNLLMSWLTGNPYMRNYEHEKLRNEPAR